MDWTLAIGLVIGGTFVAGSVAFALRLAKAGRRKGAADVAWSNILLQDLATQRGLAFAAPPAYVHPVVGPIPMFGVVSGTVDGRRVELRFENHDEDPEQLRLVIKVEAADGEHWPARGAVKPRKLRASGSTQLAELVASFATVRIEDAGTGLRGHLTVTPFPFAAARRPASPEEAAALLDRVLVLAAACTGLDRPHAHP